MLGPSIAVDAVAGVGVGGTAAGVVGVNNVVVCNDVVVVVVVVIMMPQVFFSFGRRTTTTVPATQLSNIYSFCRVFT